jgi:hypothetical protein
MNLWANSGKDMLKMWKLLICKDITPIEWEIKQHSAILDQAPNTKNKR